MNTLIRYYSKSGRTERIADIIAKELNVTAESIENEDAGALKTDVLFLGGAPYANIMAPQLEGYAKKLLAANIGKVILFTTSNWSHRTVKGLKKILSENGIEVAEEYLSVNAFRMDQGEQEAKKFAHEMCEKYMRG